MIKRDRRDNATRKATNANQQLITNRVKAAEKVASLYIELLAEMWTRFFFFFINYEVCGEVPVDLSMVRTLDTAARNHSFRFRWRN